MGVPGWCFCGGSGKSERMKAAIFSSKGPAMASVCGGTGFLIHKALLLTTHTNLPSVSAAEGVEIQLHSQSVAKLVPDRFFITSSVLDLSVIGIDIKEPDGMTQVQQTHLKSCPRPSLALGNSVYFLGHASKKDLEVGEGKVVIETDNLIKASTNGVTWKPGSAGFDVQGNLAFMVCDPMKLASSPTAKSSSSTSSYTSTKKDQSVQFGIPIPVICQWLNQHWEGSLDEISKPRIPLMRLMSNGQKSDLSSASFGVRRVFKSSEEENSDKSSPQVCPKHTRHISNASFIVSLHQEVLACHEQGIATPEISESLKLTAGSNGRKDDHPLQIHTNFISETLQDDAVSTSKSTHANNPGHLVTNQHGDHVQKFVPDKPSIDENSVTKAPPDADAYISHIDNAYDVHNEVQSTLPLELREQQNTVDEIHSEVGSSSPMGLSERRNVEDRFYAEYSNEPETMYSAETRESRNYVSPREGKLSQFSQRQNWVNLGHWTTGRRKYGPALERTPQKQQSMLAGRKMSAYRNHDYFSPTFSSMMKKRNNTEMLAAKPRHSTDLSPRWIF